MSTPDPLIRSRDIKHYAVELSAMSLHRHILAGRFPSPAATINGLRYWRRSDLIAWREGRRSGWTPDPDTAARRERMAPARAARTWKLSGRAMPHPSVTRLSIPDPAIPEALSAVIAWSRAGAGRDGPLPGCGGRGRQRLSVGEPERRTGYGTKQVERAASPTCPTKTKGMPWRSTRLEDESPNALTLSE